MDENATVPRFFLGASTPGGFVSRYDQLGSPEDGWRQYLIKGGPGTGKSTLMKRVARQLDRRCGPIQYIHCSSDVDSLDALVLPQARVAVCDATPPHVLEPQYPGAFENVVAITDCWDRELLYSRREEILSLSRTIARCHEGCIRFLSGVGAMTADASRIALEATDLEKVSRYARGIAAREAKPRRSSKGRDQVRFLSAVTNNGPVFFHQTARLLCPRIILVDDEYGAAAPVLLARLGEELREAGWDTITCFCPMAPFAKAEHLLCPGLGLGFLTVNRFHKVPGGGERTIHARRFTRQEALRLGKKRIAFQLRGARHLTDQAAALLAEAKGWHDQLETYYRDAVDFTRVNLLADRLAEEINRHALR